MYYRQENTEIFVQDLNENVTEDILFNEFSRFGAILSVAIKKHIVTHKSRGFGFVSYKNPKHALLAKQKMNGAIILGSRIRTLWKDENRTYNKDSAVLLTNIDPVVTYEDLEELAKQYGTYCTITYTSDKVDKFTKRAIIQYESVVAANTAVKGLNGLQLKEKNITAVINNRSDLIVVVKGDLKEAQDIILGKVEKICTKHGKITSIKINESKDKQKFVCFVEFEEKNSVVNCLNQFQKDAASSGLDKITAVVYQENYKRGFSSHAAPNGKSNTIVLRNVKKGVKNEQLQEFLASLGPITTLEVKPDPESDANIAEIVFEQYKSIHGFSAEYEKNPSKLNAFAVKDLEIEIQFPSSFIEQQKKKHFHNKMNKVGRGYAQNNNEQNNYQNNQKRPYKPHMNNNPMMANMMMMQYLNMANMQMQNPGMMGPQGGNPFGGGHFYGQSGMNPILLQTMNSHPPIFKAPYTNNAPQNKEEKRNADILNLQSKVHYMVPENLRGQVANIVVALTDPDNFKEQEVDQMIADPAFLQKSVNEVVKLLVEDNQ